MAHSVSVLTRAGQFLVESRKVRVAELAAVFVPAVAIIAIAGQLIDPHPVALGAVISVANLWMLIAVWGGLRLRGQDCSHFGLNFRRACWRTVVRTVFLSLVVFVVAVFAFVMGAVLMANLTGEPKAADMSGYNYLRGNLPMLVLSLAIIYVFASFGEEFIYRGFLITRIAELFGKSRFANRAAVLVSALVFGLVHYSWGLTGVVQSACMGVALGTSYVIVGRKLWVTILAHGYMDTILLLQMYFSPNMS